MFYSHSTKNNFKFYVQMLVIILKQMIIMSYKKISKVDHLSI